MIHMSYSKRIYFAAFVAALFLLSTVGAFAQSYSQDFNFTGNLTSNGWTAHSGGGTNAIATTTGLFYSGHSGSGVGNAALLNNLGGEDVNIAFTGTSTNGAIVYASFLVNITDPATSKTGDYFFHLGSPGGATWTAYSARVFARIVSGSVNFGLSNTSTATYGTSSFSRNTTYLIVLKYTIVTGTTADPVSMWVLPAGVPSTEFGAGPAEVTNTTTNGTDAISAVGLRQGSATASTQVVVDAIRVGATWTSVMPASGSAPTTQASGLGFTNATSNSVTVSWTAGSGDGRIVKINTTNSFTDPTGGQTYTPNATYAGSGEQVVSAGTALSATVSNLSPGQTYYFRAYEYSNTGMLYNTSTATSNPASTTLNYPMPTLSAISPTSASAGGSSFTLTVTGTDFYPASVVNWGGSPRTTTYVNSTTLTAAISAADIATAGPVDVTVFNPLPGGGSSAPQQFIINSNTQPIISVNSSLSNFITSAGAPSASQSYTVSGSNLGSDITITPPAGFEIRTGANAFSASSVVLSQSGGTVPSTTVDVRFNPSVSGTFSGNIDHASTGASPQAVAVSGFALETEPATPSSLSFGTVSGTSIDVNTSGGSGSSRIIVIRATSAVSYTPADAAAVSGVNALFTAAADQGSGNKIVYDGTGNTVTVTGLTASTTYHFAVYEYNGSGTTANYQITGAGTATTTTLAAEPTTAATVSLTRVFADTSVIGFASGNGASRLVVLSTSPVTFVPSDATVYAGASGVIAAAADLGSGNLLVFNNTSATAITVTGLAAGTTYYVRSYEYNGSGTGINYRTSTFGSLSFTTPSNISYSTAGSTYTQDFNGLPSTGSTGMTGFRLGPYYLSTPAVNATNMTGWQHSLVGGTSADVVFGIDNGSNSGGGVKSYGSTGSSNRALGSLATGSAVPVFGAVFVNNTGLPLTTINVAFTGQQWRVGGTGTPNLLTFSYSLNGTNITNGTFTDVPSATFMNPVSGSIAAALDGTQPGNQVPVSGSFTLSPGWMPGQTLVIRWTDVNDAGNDEGLAIDDFTLTALAPQAPTQQDSLIAFTNVLTTSMDVTWQSGNGSNRLVKINTSNTFTDPVNSNGYTANSVYSGSGEQVVYNGNAGVVHVDGLTAGTTYHFRVYGYNGSGTSAVYNTGTAQDNPNSQTTAAPSAATKLVVTSVNGGSDPVMGMPFNVVVQSQDNSGNPQTVNVSTTVTLSVNSGFGTLGGTITGTIPAGSSAVTISGVTYSAEDFAVVLQAAATSGMTLTAGLSNSFNVLGVAANLVFPSPPLTGIVNTTLSNIIVQALRNDYTLDSFYTGPVTIAISSGPSGGTMSGTTTVNCISGVATFSTISFNLPGAYELTAISGGLTPAVTAPPITITLNPTFTELVVPKYIAGKTASGSHNARVPFAVCLKIDNLVPNTPYDIKAGVGTDTTAATSYGSGNVWTGAAWAASNISSAFTTDASGSSGPFWVYIQPTASSTNSRFAAGFNHNLRIGFAPNGSLMPIAPNFVGTKLMTALDIGNTAQTPATTDDGAFLKGSSLSCIGGKFVLFYDNTSGTGDPMSVYQARTMIAPNTVSQTELPAAINDIFLQTSTNPLGDYGAVVPIGVNNTNGVRRIEVRNTDNTLFNAVTVSDGNWGTGANTATLLRRDVATVTLATANLNTISVSATATGESCTGALDGTATAVASSTYSPVSYSWSSTPAQLTAIATGLGAGSYSVTATDNVGCTATASATVNPPAGVSITAGGPTTFCNGGSVTLTASAASGYLWSNGETTQSITVTTSGNYTVTLNTGTCNATTLPVAVTVNNYEFSGTVFSENMGTPTGTTSVNTFAGWQNTAPVTFNAGTSGTDVRTTTVSTGYSGASGGGNIFFGTTGGNLKTLTISGINTSGYSALTMSYGMLRSDLTNGMTVEVSTDGVNFSPLTVTQPTAANTWQLITVNTGIPATANLRLRFSKNFTTSFRLDDIRITGSTTTPTVTALGPTAVCGSGSVVLQTNVPSGILWSYNGSTGRTLTVNTAGSYGYTATGTNGCTAAAVPVSFSVNPEPNATASTGTINCNGGTTGVTVSAADGTAPYSNTGTFTVSAGAYSYVVTDANGCDDTVSVNVTQPAAISGTSNVGACDSYTWTANSQTYTASGTYTAVLPAANGCDSTATLVLTITASTTNTTTATACDSYTWTVNGQVYTQSGTYSSVNGCNTEVLQLTVNASTTTTTTASSCGSYTWAVNGQSYTQSGTYTYVSGCQTDVLVLTITSCNGGTIDLTLYLEGYYAGLGTMQPVLLNQGVANAVGTETDTIIVELRDSLDPSITVDATTALLMTDGGALASFTAAVPGTSYWIVVKHRMSVQTWSAAPVVFSASASYDFSTSAAQAFGSNMLEVETGVFAFYSADMNQDEFTDPFDFSLYLDDALNFAVGYNATDLNGDGFTDPFDFTIYLNNSINFTMSAHP
jgi:hypothetical protein